MSNEKNWCITSGDLNNLTPIKARDLIIKCFFEAQKETFARMKQKANVDNSDEKVLQTIIGGVKIAFKSNGCDYDNPTKNDFPKIIQYLANKALSWGTPQDIIEFHKKEIEKVIKNLK